MLQGLGVTGARSRADGLNKGNSGVIRRSATGPRDDQSSVQDARPIAEKVRCLSNNAGQWGTTRTDYPGTTAWGSFGHHHALSRSHAAPYDTDIVSVWIWFLAMYKAFDSDTDTHLRVLSPMSVANETGP